MARRERATAAGGRPGERSWEGWAFSDDLRPTTATSCCALTWNDRGAAVVRYDPATGAPLSDPGVRNAVVTYAYADHPSHALGADPPNRYQLLGVVDVDGSPALAVLTLDRATLEVGAQLLRRHGVTGDVLTFDGGVSTYLWTARDGDLELPHNGDVGGSALPHYLCVHRR